MRFCLGHRQPDRPPPIGPVWIYPLTFGSHGILDVNLLHYGTALPIRPNALYLTSRYPCYVCLYIGQTCWITWDRQISRGAVTPRSRITKRRILSFCYTRSILIISYFFMNCMKVANKQKFFLKYCFVLILLNLQPLVASFLPDNTIQIPVVLLLPVCYR